MITTSRDSRTNRVRVDNQQTSFEENRQFKFYDDCTGDDNIAVAETLIYKFSSANPLKIQLRLINGFAGSRKYTVYPYNGTETIVGGAFVDVTPTKVSPINNDLSVSQLSTHPVSGVTIEKRIATSFSTTAPKRTGTGYLSEGQGNSQTSSYTASGNAPGVASGDVFLLVFENITGNDAADFLFQIEWEEVFP